MANSPEVYLDHLIVRENLRYKRSDDQLQQDTRQLPHLLRMVDLVGDHLASRDKKLRKPDFQRATWAWSPDECVSLLDSVVNEQVVPSIIMWPSADNGFDFVLDGAHRISVVMAWLKDDWGQDVHADSGSPLEEEDQLRIAEAADAVRRLVDAKIGTFADYVLAAQRFDRVVEEGEAPKRVLDTRTLKRAQFYQKLSRGDIGFNILWVTGDYERAEQSFLKINRSGRPLTDWETKLVENRNSSFARAVMSISNIASSRHYWPIIAPEGADQDQLREKIRSTLSGVDTLHTTLFNPPYQPQIRRLKLPLLAPTETEKKPYWVAELLTIIAGGKGQESETEKLLRRDQISSERDIIGNGFKLVQDTIATLDHLVGPSPRSMGLIPALYFYSETGRYVRSLLYGLVYWLTSSNDDDTILARKRAFCAHRAAFEQVLLNRKQEIVTRISRNSGSGPEVTYPTARYYQGLMELLIERQDDIQSEAFAKAYLKLLNGLTDKKSRSVETAEIKSRNFTDKQKNTLVLRQRLNSLDKCGICGGLLDPEDDVQHDHIVERFRGGPTSADNQRMVHPFCNNQSNREAIEAMHSGQMATRLPEFIDPELGTSIRQLSFMDTPGFF